MIKTNPASEKEIEETAKNSDFVYWYESPDEDGRYGGHIATVLLYTRPELTDMQKLEGISYTGRLLKYENDIIGTFRVVIGRKTGKKNAKKMVNKIWKDRDKIITASDGRSLGSPKMLECAEFPDRLLEKNSFYIKDNEFGKHRISFIKNILSYYMVVDIKRPSKKIALHDAEGLACKYFSW